MSVTVIPDIVNDMISVIVSRAEKFAAKSKLRFFIYRDGALCPPQRWIFKEGEHVECAVNIGLILRETYTMVFQRSIPPFRILILTCLYLMYLKRTNVMVFLSMKIRTFTTERANKNRRCRSW